MSTSQWRPATRCPYPPAAAVREWAQGSLHIARQRPTAACRATLGQHLRAVVGPVVERWRGWDHRQVDTIDDQREPNRYKVTLDQLERSVRVPVEDQGIEQPADPIAAGESDWDNERRQLRLAGGA